MAYQKRCWTFQFIPSYIRNNLKSLTKYSNAWVPSGNSWWAGQTEGNMAKWLHGSLRNFHFPLVHAYVGATCHKKTSLVLDPRTHVSSSTGPEGPQSVPWSYEDEESSGFSVRLNLPSNTPWTGVTQSQRSCLCISIVMFSETPASLSVRFSWSKIELHET